MKKYVIDEELPNIEWAHIQITGPGGKRIMRPVHRDDVKRYVRVNGKRINLDTACSAKMANQKVCYFV